MWTGPQGSGDASGSYCYRAALLLDGQWQGLWAMWHPPGYPILVALASLATGKLLTPWWAGNLLNLACYVWLIVLADRLLAPRVSHVASRLVCMALLAFNENLAQWQSAPLSEAVFLVMCLGAIVAYDRDQIEPRHALVAGLLAGAAFTVRLEGGAAAAGLLAYTAWRTRSLPLTAMALGGCAIGGGWLAVQVDFFERGSQYRLLYNSFEVKTVRTVADLLEIGRSVLTLWLPYVLLLPQWCALAIGVQRFATEGPSGRRFNALAAATVVPILGAIALTVPMKRTGVVLLAPAMIWIAAAADQWWTAERGGRGHWRRAFVSALVVLACAVEAGRVARLALPAGRVKDPVERQVEALRANGATRGPIWAFGNERLIYGILGWPERFDYRNAASIDGPVLGDRSAEAFVAELRQRRYRYLTFELPPGDSERVSHVDWHSLPPRRDLLNAIVAAPARFGLRVLAGPSTVPVFEIE